MSLLRKNIKTSPVKQNNRRLFFAAQSSLETADEIIGLLFPDTLNDVAIRLWNGTFAHGGHCALCTLVINEPETVGELLLHPRLVEVYLDGGLDVEGDFETLFKLGTLFKTLELHLAARIHLVRLALSLPKKNKQHSAKYSRTKRRIRKNSKQSIAHHYDLGNNFYHLWLDPLFGQ